MWYKTHGRHDLPWRQTHNPYHIWLSEVMLQQTQVATVRDRFYFPFLEKFPTIEALAAAERESVMKAWEGLGYYRRAGFLHEAAKRLINPLPLGEGRAQRGVRAKAATYAQRMPSPSPLKRVPSLSQRERVLVPDSLHQLLTLPGIGKNTAHAILAFAYHQPVAILEANVKRVVARIFAYEKPSDAELWAGAEALLNHAAPFEYNQAMMDIGSLICTPKNPSCGQCPARSICIGKASPERYPAPKAKKAIPTREVIIQVRADTQGRLFLEKRSEALLGGLYGFPQDSGFGIQDSGKPIKSKSGSGKLAAQSITSSLPESRIPNPESTFLGSVTHTYSHFKLVGRVMFERVAGNPNSADWYRREEIAALPLSTLDHKVLALVENCHTAQKKRTKPAKRRRTR